MQDLFKYKGYSVFCYCEPSTNSGKYKVNFLIQDVDNEKPAKHTMKLEQEFSDIQMALQNAGDEARKYIDLNDSGLTHADMKDSIE